MAYDLENAFMYHAPQPAQVGRYEQIRAAGAVLAGVIVASSPESAEQTLALRKVQEAVMWGNASIAINETGISVPEIRSTE